MTRTVPVSPRVHALEDALRALAETHGLNGLLRDTLPPATQALIRGAVSHSARRADALARARAEATR